MKGSNRYNVSAIRRELDGHIRNRAWKRLRSKLEELSSNPELLQAVVLTNKSKLGNRGSLLHAILKHKSESISSLSIFIAKSVPQCLHVQDSRDATPFHLAIESGQSTTLVESMFMELHTLEKGNSKQKLASILLATDRAGDNPLLKAAREDAIHMIPLLLRYDNRMLSSTLLQHKRKNRIALWYCVSNETQCAYKFKNYIVPRELRALLLGTFFAMRQSLGQEIPQGDWHKFHEQLEDEKKTPSQLTRTDDSQGYKFCLPLLLRALVATSHLLGKLSVKLLDLMLENDDCRELILSRKIDMEGNYLLHHLCNADVRFSPDPVSARTTISLLLDLLKRHDGALAFVVQCGNSAGDLPLHLAITNYNLYVTGDLLAAYPKAAQHANRKGELPIHILLKLGPPFAEDISVLNGTINELLKVCPSTVTIRDGPTKLYPFQLASCCKWGRMLQAANCSDADDDSLSNPSPWVGIIYELLLAAPQVL